MFSKLFKKNKKELKDIIDFKYGSAPGKNDYWHTREDSIDKLSMESLQIVGRVVVHIINELGKI